MKSVRVMAITAVLVALLVLATTCGEDDKPTPPVSNAPTACFTVSPGSGTTDTVFQFDASCSSDKKGPVSALEVRWDWENDETWDTGWSATKTATHQYSVTGTKTINLEVKDTEGLTDQTTRQVQVTSDGPAPPGMVLVPAGTFIMGDGQAYCGANEHQVTLTYAFYIDQYEVTNERYRDALQWAYTQGHVTATSSSVEDNLDGSTEELVELDDSDCEISFSGGTFTVESGKENHPVLEVSWYGAVAYCDWLSLQEGLPRAYDHFTWQCNGGDPYGATGYRLPTDAEWEYAAQYDDERIYPWGDEEPTCSRANCGPYPEDCVGSATAVGSYPAAPAPLGLYDMAGNVMEWCNDWHTCDLGTAAQTDPAGPGSGTIRVLRGGSWSNSDWSHLRCAYRLANDPSRTTQNHGFRCVRSQ